MKGGRLSRSSGFDVCFTSYVFCYITIDREVLATENAEDPAESADRPGPDEQDGSGQPKPSERLHTVLNMLSGVNSGLQVRQQVVPKHIQVKHLFRVVENQYGEGHTSEVQAPTLDQDILQDLTPLPSAPPAPLDDQTFRGSR